MYEQHRFLIGGITFDAVSGELSAPAAARRLEPKAASVLALLCKRPGQVMTRQELLDRCWGKGEGSDEALTQAVSQVRRTLQDLGEPPNLLETLAKRGYRLGGETAEDHRGPKPNGRASKSRRGWMIGCVVVLALAVGLVAFPHEVRHVLRHNLGLGPPSAGAPMH